MAVASGKTPSLARIVTGWFVAGLGMPALFVYARNPLAGLLLFSVFFGVLMVALGPGAHFWLARRAAQQDAYRPCRTVPQVLGGPMLLAFVIAASGVFDFA